MCSTSFDPDYPTPAAQQYRDNFIAGAEHYGLTAIPADLLSKAISFAIAGGLPGNIAGGRFAAAYFRHHRIAPPPLRKSFRFRRFSHGGVSARRDGEVIA